MEKQDKQTSNLKQNYSTTMTKSEHKTNGIGRKQYKKFLCFLPIQFSVVFFTQTQLFGNLDLLPWQSIVYYSVSRELRTGFFLTMFWIAVQNGFNQLTNKESSAKCYIYTLAEKLRKVQKPQECASKCSQKIQNPKSKPTKKSNKAVQRQFPKHFLSRKNGPKWQVENNENCRKGKPRHKKYLPNDMFPFLLRLSLGFNISPCS